MINLFLTLQNGDRYFIRSNTFNILEETRKTPIKYLGDLSKPTEYRACSVNGYSVLETFDEVIDKIEKQS